MWTSCTACRCTWGGCGRRSHVIIPERPCGCGEIGRRAGFRFQFPQGSVGSSPIIRTNKWFIFNDLYGKLLEQFWLLFGPKQITKQIYAVLRRFPPTSFFAFCKGICFGIASVLDGTGTAFFCWRLQASSFAPASCKFFRLTML